VQTSAADFAAGPKTIDRAAAFGIHGDSAHVVVHRGPNRNWIGRRIDPGHFAERRNHGIAFGKLHSRMRSRVEENTMSFGAAMPDCARDDVAGRQFGAGLVRHETQPGFVDQGGAVAAHSLGHQRHRSRRPVEGGRMELDEFEIGKLCARARRQRETLAETPRRVGAVQKQPADAAGREHDPTAIDHQRTVRIGGEHALDGVVLDNKAARLDAFQQRDRRTAAHRCDQRTHDLAAGAVAGGVHDPVAAVRGLEAEPPAAIGPAVEGDAKPREMFDGRRRRIDDPCRDGFIAKIYARSEGVSQMQGGGVVVAHRCGEAALRPQAGGICAERRFRKQQHRFWRELQCRHQSCGAAADDHWPVIQG
jgi:hypothetical protein